MNQQRRDNQKENSTDAWFVLRPTSFMYSEYFLMVSCFSERFRCFSLFWFNINSPLWCMQCPWISHAPKKCKGKSHFWRKSFQFVKPVGQHGVHVSLVLDCQIEGALPLVQVNVEEDGPWPVKRIRFELHKKWILRVFSYAYLKTSPPWSRIFSPSW